jgi:hypothetical protein
MVDLLVLLCPPRSFSSVVSTVIGQHPEMYGFPELHLFMGDQLQDVMEWERKRGKHLGPPGALRTLAQLHTGTQTAAGVLDAHEWLNARRDWSSKKVMDYLLHEVEEQYAPRIAVEKTPPVSLNPEHLERTHAFYPNAYFLHVTRHPIANRKSLIEARDVKDRQRGVTEVEREHRADPISMWALSHLNVMDFADTLPAGQCMRVKGEDILSEPDTFLPQIAEWLGLRTDKAAIDEMKHPERSPYAKPGPVTARGGNDGKFMSSPALRSGKIKEPSLIEHLRDGDLRGKFKPEEEDYLIELSARLGYE